VTCPAPTGPLIACQDDSGTLIIAVALHTLAKSLETPQAGDLLLSLVDSTEYRLKQTPVEPGLSRSRYPEREPPRAGWCWGSPANSEWISASL
jgi:hypothetical protein